MEIRRKGALLGPLPGVKSHRVPPSAVADATKKHDPMGLSRKEFMARWIPMGVDLWARCEGYGIDWRRHRLEELDFLCDLAEGAKNESD